MKSSSIFQQIAKVNLASNDLIQTPSERIKSVVHQKRVIDYHQDQRQSAMI
jgi:hypothetical protein